jgi:phenylacetate-CoA ligase
MKKNNFIYENSPIWLQNLIISAYGLILYNRRYRGKCKEYLEYLMKSQYWNIEEFKQFQLQKLKGLIEYVYLNVPYYQKLFTELNLNPEDIKTLEDIRKIPILDKESVRKNQERLISKEYNPKSLYEWPTSGTTGKPISIMVSQDALNRNYAFLLRLKNWLRLPEKCKTIRISGNIIIQKSQLEPPFYRREYFTNRWHFSLYHISEQNLKYYYEAIKEIQPDLISSYPSSIYVIARYMKKKGLNRIHPKAIITSAETLLSYQREVIEDVFQCRVTDQYGSTEMTHFVHQCEKGNYHINPEYGIIEVVDSGNKPVSSGQSGEIICTGFCNYAMPLLRYRLGDIVTITDAKCKCGLDFPMLKNIVGRNSDQILTPDGSIVPILDILIFRNLKNIIEAQIIQESIDEIKVKLVAGDNFSNSDVLNLKKEFRNRLGDAMKVKLEYVKSIPKDKNGKFRSVISRIDDKCEIKKQKEIKC